MKGRYLAIFDKQKALTLHLGLGEGPALTQKWHVVSLLGLRRCVG